MLTMQLYKLTSVLAAQKRELQLTQTEQGGLEWSGEWCGEEYKHSRVQDGGYVHNRNTEPQDGKGFSCVKNIAGMCKYISHGIATDGNRATM